jgi:hypothetical protein
MKYNISNNLILNILIIMSEHIRFNPFTQYIFVNMCMNKLYGKLPSNCYYDDNHELDNFWNKLETKDYEVIYNYLIKLKLIEEVKYNINYKDIV